jgi:hypothetical protein
MNVNWCASCLPSPLDDALDTTTNSADVVVPAEKGSSSSKVIDAPGASESIPTLPIKRSMYAATALRPTAVAEARDDEVHASSSSVHAAEDNSGREDVKGTDFLEEESSSLPHSDSIKSIVSAIAADINGLFECKAGSNGDAAFDGKMDDASKSTTTVEEPTTETKPVSSSSSTTHRSKLSSKLLSISASMLRNQSTNKYDSPQASPPPPPPPPPKEESNLHLLVSKLWTAEQTVDATSNTAAIKQDTTTEDNGQCDDSSVSKSRREMIKSATNNKAVIKEKASKGNKSFVVTRATFTNAFINAKTQKKKKDAKKNGEKGTNAVEGSNTSNVVKQRTAFVGRMKHKRETQMKKKRDTKKVSKTTTTTANSTAPQTSLTNEPVGVAVTTPFSTTIATAAGMLSRLSYDYYQVVIAGQNSKSDMMVRVPYNQQTTFADVRRELEEDYHDDLPKPDYKFCITPDFTIGVSKAQESKWRVRDYDLTTQGGDGTYKMPYFVYIMMDRGKKEESKEEMKNKRRALWSKK